jgi:hypothetical protein
MAILACFRVAYEPGAEPASPTWEAKLKKKNLGG